MSFNLVFVVNKVDVLLVYFLLFFFFNLISQFVLKPGGEEDATYWASFIPVFSTLFIKLLELRPRQNHLVSDASGSGTNMCFLDLVKQMSKSP